MRILITGGTGFVGAPLAASLRTAGHMVLACSRRTPAPSSSSPVHPRTGGPVAWDGRDPETLRPLLSSVDVVINLQGENIGAQRWTPERRRVLLQSRCQAGEALTTALTALASQRNTRDKMPHTLLQASACGYYGLWASNAPPCPEDSPSGSGFLADVCRQWEASTAGVEDLGVRRCVLRLSPVLGQNAHSGPGGFLQRMVLPWHFFMGGPLGPGTQPMSWVHLHDVAGVVHMLLDRPDLRGAFNVCAPHCPDMNEFARTLGRVLHRPSLVRAPGFALRLALGDMADELVLAGQHPVPARLSSAGYAWRWPTLEEALRQVLR